MKNMIKKVYDKHSEMERMFSDNREALEKNNSDIFRALSVIGMLVMVFMAAVKAFNPETRHLCGTYIIFLIIMVVLYSAFRFTSLKNRRIIGIYCLGVITYCFGIYMSIVRAPEERATAIIGLFCFIPLCLIDKPVRVWIFNGVFLVVHSIMAFMVKDHATAHIDMENCICFYLMGVLFGVLITMVRLQSYDAQRLLVIEKTTDSLTGLFNRRKLYETISNIKDGTEKMPSGVLLMDIDSFKELNDKFGHACGNESIYYFGKLLLEEKNRINADFFRYGGDEFIGFIYDEDRDSVRKITEEICDGTRKIDLNEAKMTVSIGVAFCDDEDIRDCEYWIERADAAAYTAKENGRDRAEYC